MLLVLTLAAHSKKGWIGERRAHRLALGVVGVVRRLHSLGGSPLARDGVRAKGAWVIAGSGLNPTKPVIQPNFVALLGFIIAPWVVDGSQWAGGWRQGGSPV